LRNKLIPASVERIKSNLKRILKNIIKLNISSDIWSDPDLRAFIAFGAHGIDDEWKLIKCVIGVRRIIGSHTNELIQKEFIELAKEYGIENNVYKFITDGGSNFVKAFNEDNLTKYCNLFDELVQDIEIEDEIEEKQAENSESSIDQDDNVDDDDIDDEELEKIMQDIDTIEIVKSICQSLNGVKRYGCAAHHIQTVIKKCLVEDIVSELIKKLV